MGVEAFSLGAFGDERLEKKGAQVLGRMVLRQSVCLRRLASGARRDIIGFDRFFSNDRVSLERLIEGWGTQARAACAGRHVLAIQDTSEINFRTREGHRRGLGEIGRGSGRGLLLHAMLGVDAESGALLGLVAGRIWTRKGRVGTPHAQRSLPDKESDRWLATAEAAKPVLERAAVVTEVSDRGSDIYAKWARVPGDGFHLLTRAAHDRLLADGGTLSGAPLAEAGAGVVETLRERADRPGRQAQLRVRYGPVELVRPKNTREKGLAGTVRVSLVEVREIDPLEGAEPLLWRLLTTHEVGNAAMAWRVVGWYRQRWIIEQFFRTLKQQGLRLEDSQMESAERLLKLTAVAANAAALILQIVQARDGVTDQEAALAFSPLEIQAMTALVPRLEGNTALQKNPHRPATMAWAAWVIAKLGGWDGYPRSTPPGPITFRHGLEAFKAIAQGWSLHIV